MIGPKQHNNISRTGKGSMKKSRTLIVVAWITTKVVEVVPEGIGVGGQNLTDIGEIQLARKEVIGIIFKKKYVYFILTYF